MISNINSCNHIGLNCQKISVECFLSRSLPHFTLIGLADAALKEAKERVRAAIISSNFNFPLQKITVNLSPAEIKKQGSHFDLSIALSILVATGQIKEIPNNYLFLGELSLNGSLKPVKSILLMADFAQKNDLTLVIPKGNMEEAKIVPNLKVLYIQKLSDIKEFQNKTKEILLTKKSILYSKTKSFSTYNSIQGQERLKRALVIAAAGFHNLYFEGSPGVGKSLAAKAYRELLPALTYSEALETSKIHSISGLLSKEKPLLKNRPYRAINSSITKTSLLGGGQYPKPGEISYAHNGILFLDEISEFPRSILESLRQPLEEREILVSRSKFSVKYPADFSLIATSNPCPCANLFHPQKNCTCSERQIYNYQKKVSSALLDRIDIYLRVEKSSSFTVHKAINAKKLQENNSILINSLLVAQKKQILRAKAENKEKLPNSRLSLCEIKKYCNLNLKLREHLKKAEKKYSLSSRSILSVLKIARTIADLDDSQNIEHDHLAEALAYKKK